MPSTLPSSGRGQVLALAILAIVLLSVWVLTVAPARDWYENRAESIERQHAMARRMAALVETLPDLRREVERSGTGSESDPNWLPPPLLLSGASDALAAASLQQRIEELAGAAGVRVSTQEILPVRQDGEMRVITVRLAVTAPFSSLVALLSALIHSEIPLVVDEAQLRALPATSRDTDQPLSATLAILSFRIASKPD